LVLPLAFPRPLLVGPGLAGSVPRSWPSFNAPSALQLQAFFVHHVLRSFVVQKFGMTTCVRNNDVCNIGKSKSLGGCGSGATAGLPDNARPGFPIKSHVPSARSLNGTRFRRIIRNAGCVRRLATWPRSCWRFNVESINCPLPMLPNGAGASDQNDAGSETRFRQPPVNRVTLCDVRAPTGVD
jgi:hypothetical protein